MKRYIFSFSVVAAIAISATVVTSCDKKIEFGEQTTINKYFHNLKVAPDTKQGNADE